MHALALTYQAQGRNADAARIQEEVLEKQRRILGEEHPHTLTAMHALALTYQAQGRNADAARIQEEVLEKRRRILGEEHPHTLTAMHALALTYQAQGRNADAARIQEEVLEKERRILGEEHPHTLTAMHCPRLDISSAGKKCRCGQDSGGSVGEGEEDIGRRAPGHAHGHALPSPRHIKRREEMPMRPGFRRKCWRRRGGYWEKSTRTRSGAPIPGLNGYYLVIFCK